MGPVTFLRSLGRILKGQPRIPPSLQENELLQTILRRRSVRSFRRQPIPDDVFSAILEAGRLAPSTVNLQSWSFAAFDAVSWSQTFERPIPFKAARAVVILGDMHRVRSLGIDFPESALVDYTTAVINASLAAMNMNLAAEALGVSSVMLSETGRSGMLDAGYLKVALALPDKVFPLMTIVFGYPAGLLPPMPPKLPLETVRFEGRYREADPNTMHAWLDQMIAGYKAGHLNSSFDAQLKVYSSKIDQAERDLHEMIFSPKI